MSSSWSATLYSCVLASRCSLRSSVVKEARSAKDRSEQSSRVTYTRWSHLNFLAPAQTDENKLTPPANRKKQKKKLATAKRKPTNSMRSAKLLLGGVFDDEAALCQHLVKYWFNYRRQTQASYGKHKQPKRKHTQHNLRFLREGSVAT